MRSRCIVVNGRTATQSWCKSGDVRMVQEKNVRTTHEKFAALPCNGPLTAASIRWSLSPGALVEQRHVMIPDSEISATDVSTAPMQSIFNRQKEACAATPDPLLGIVGTLLPFNYPIDRGFVPLTTALASGADCAPFSSILTARRCDHGHRRPARSGDQPRSFGTAAAS